MKYSYLLLLFISCSIAATAQKVYYRVSFPNAVHHEARITLTVTGIPNGPAVFRMSRSSPGRYATHEFGKNVYQVSAEDKSGKALKVARTDGDIYQVTEHGNNISISYTLYGDYADGTYAGIDPESIHLNMPACFMWMVGMDNAPIEIRFDPPAGNKGVIATQLKPTGDPHVFTAPGLQFFMDSPTKIGDLHITRWDISNPDGATYKMGIALESIATPEQENELAGKVQRMVAEAKAVYGEFPKYDYGTYTFLASINSYVHGDGMEHRNSTMITVPIPRLNVDRVLGVFAHEYFHNWNVERIRPKTLEPFNFTKSNMSNELWFAEGFTQYYGNLLLARAGLLPAENYLSILTGLINTKVNTPGARLYSPVQASNHAVFVDAGVSIDRNNYANMFTSYYPYGAAIALALDIEMQTRYHKTLDAYMRAMWQRFGKTEIPYTLTTMQETLAAVTDKSFAENFFGRYILGHDSLPYTELMHKAGYILQLSKPGSAYIGARLQSSEGKLVISSNTQIGTPAYEAGLDINDEILSIDGTPLHTPDDLNNWLQAHHPGESVIIQFRHRNTEQQATIRLGENPILELVPEAQPDASAASIRKSWFATHSVK